MAQCQETRFVREKFTRERTAKKLAAEALPHQLNDKPRDMAFRHEVLHIRRQQQCLIDIPGAKILAHSPRLNQTRSELNSDYSDRLLGPIGPPRSCHLAMTRTFILCSTTSAAGSVKRGARPAPKPPVSKP